jgi:hypothetical protein
MYVIKTEILKRIFCIDSILFKPSITDNIEVLKESINDPIAYIVH